MQKSHFELFWTKATKYVHIFKKVLQDKSCKLQIIIQGWKNWSFFIFCKACKSKYKKIILCWYSISILRWDFSLYPAEKVFEKFSCKRNLFWLLLWKITSKHKRALNTKERRILASIGKKLKSWEKIIDSLFTYVKNR